MDTMTLYEGLPDVEALAIILIDASSSMTGIELQTGEPKHLRCAWMVQELLNGMDDPQYAYAYITVACFSTGGNGAKVVCLLDEHNPFEQKTYTENMDVTIWDGLSPANRVQGMGGTTPIGTAIAWARQKAEQWVNTSPGQVQRRAVIYLLSDGMSNDGPDGREEKKAIAAFNASCETGYVRLATIGYFQNLGEEAGRQLLEELPLNRKAYFEANNVKDIVGYILSTITDETEQETPYKAAF